MENTMKEFIAFSRKLLRSLKKIRQLMDDANYEENIQEFENFDMGQRQN